MQHWLMKSEADCYSIDDLRRDKRTLWTEVRNYQARNFMRDMQVGDIVLFYHSNGGPATGIAGEAKVSKTAVADPTQFDATSEYYDAKSSKEKPRWECVEVQFVKKYTNPVLLSDLKAKKQYHDMIVAQQGSRLSVTPVKRKHFDLISKAGS